jgi:hypothetical protein
VIPQPAKTATLRKKALIYLVQRWLIERKEMREKELFGKTILNIIPPMVPSSSPNKNFPSNFHHSRRINVTYSGCLLGSRIHNIHPPAHWVAESSAPLCQPIG